MSNQETHGGASNPESALPPVPQNTRELLERIDMLVEGGQVLVRLDGPDGQTGVVDTVAGGQHINALYLPSYAEQGGRITATTIEVGEKASPLAVATNLGITQTLHAIIHVPGDQPSSPPNIMALISMSAGEAKKLVLAPLPLHENDGRPTQASLYGSTSILEDSDQQPRVSRQMGGTNFTYDKQLDAVFVTQHDSSVDPILVLKPSTSRDMLGTELLGEAWMVSTLVPPEELLEVSIGRLVAAADERYGVSVSDQTTEQQYVADQAGKPVTEQASDQIYTANTPNTTDYQYGVPPAPAFEQAATYASDYDYGQGLPPEQVFDVFGQPTASQQAYDYAPEATVSDAYPEPDYLDVSLPHAEGAMQPEYVQATYDHYPEQPPEYYEEPQPTYAVPGVETTYAGYYAPTPEQEPQLEQPYQTQPTSVEQQYNDQVPKDFDAFKPYVRTPTDNEPYQPADGESTLALRTVRIAETVPVSSSPAPEGQQRVDHRGNRRRLFSRV